ncbi:MAG: hypothetical protein PHY43_03915 [Verrucomicrobiales bacterium]|nr:hypothetical protein [Verrucomicrobiales bacterium]
MNNSLYDFLNYTPVPAAAGSTPAPSSSISDFLGAITGVAGVAAPVITALKGSGGTKLPAAKPTLASAASGNMIYIVMGIAAVFLFGVLMFIRRGK